VLIAVGELLIEVEEVLIAVGKSLSAVEEVVIAVENRRLRWKAIDRGCTFRGKKASPDDTLAEQSR
jgi:hypothetical protein